LGGIPKDRRSRYARCGLLEQFQPFPTHAVLGTHETGDVAARTRQARNQAGADRVTRRRENNEDDRCRLLGGHDRSSRRRDDDINLAPDEFGRDLGGALGATLRPAILDRDRATLDSAEFAQPLDKGGDPLARDKEPDGRQLRRLLRPRRERPRRRTADERNEVAPWQRIGPCFGPVLVVFGFGCHRLASSPEQCLANCGPARRVRLRRPAEA